MKKLKLDELNVSSFVTKFDSEKQETINGGLTPTTSIVIVSLYTPSIAASIVSILSPEPPKKLETQVHCTDLQGCTRVPSCPPNLETQSACGTGSGAQNGVCHG